MIPECQRRLPATAAPISPSSHQAAPPPDDPPSNDATGALSTGALGFTYGSGSKSSDASITSTGSASSCGGRDIGVLTGGDDLLAVRALAGAMLGSLECAQTGCSPDEGNSPVCRAER